MTKWRLLIAVCVLLALTLLTADASAVPVISIRQREGLASGLCPGPVAVWVPDRARARATR